MEAVGNHMKTNKWKKPLIEWFDNNCSSYGESEELNLKLRQTYVKLVNDQLADFLGRVKIPLIIFEKSKEIAVLE